MPKIVEVLAAASAWSCSFGDSAARDGGSYKGLRVLNTTRVGRDGALRCPSEDNLETPQRAVATERETMQATRLPPQIQQLDGSTNLSPMDRV